jgi:hypothetical protein
MGDYRTRPDEIGRAGEDRAVIALAAGASKEDAAALAGISRSTLYEWLKEPALRGRVQAERQRLVDRAVGRLADASVHAADTLLQIASDTTAPASARVAAARGILEIGGRLREEAELVARLDDLERVLDERDGVR